MFSKSSNCRCNRRRYKKYYRSNATKYLNDNVDVVIGGSPCQSYSTLGKRQMDAMAHLFEEYCRILSIVKPTLLLSILF